MRSRPRAPGMGTNSISSTSPSDRCDDETERILAAPRPVEGRNPAERVARQMRLLLQGAEGHRRQFVVRPLFFQGQQRGADIGAANAPKTVIPGRPKGPSPASSNTGQAFDFHRPRRPRSCRSSQSSRPSRAPDGKQTVGGTGKQPHSGKRRPLPTPHRILNVAPCFLRICFMSCSRALRRCVGAGDLLSRFWSPTQVGPRNTWTNTPRDKCPGRKDTVGNARHPFHRPASVCAVPSLACPWCRSPFPRQIMPSSGIPAQCTRFSSRSPGAGRVSRSDRTAICAAAG